MEIKAYLNEKSIKYTLHKHPPVFTSEDAKLHYTGIKGISAKNLFLISKCKSKKVLYSIPDHKRADLKSLAKYFGVSKFSFAKPEILLDELGVTPGSVSPFTLINAKDHSLIYLLDKEIRDSKFVAFHPNINTETLSMSQTDFQKFLNSVEVEIIVYD